MTQTVAEIFAAVSRELRQLAGLTTSLQDQLSTSGYENLDIETFQSVDCLNQTLDCLATYVAQVGVLMPSGHTVAIEDAADRICLAALAERLRGNACLHSRVNISEVELF